MLGNLFGAIGALGRLLPGYVQGERQAVQDNWNDLNQYNQVQQGQFQNAYAEATFDPAVQMFKFNRDILQNNALNNFMQTSVQAAMYPGALTGAQLSGQVLPYVMPAQQWGMLGQALAPWMMGNRLGAATGLWPSQMGQQPYYNPMNLPSSQR